MAQQNAQNPNPQTNQQQAQQTVHVHKHEHHHHIDNGLGWGAMLVAGCVGFLFGQFLADGNQTQPAPTKHFWQ